MKAILWIAFAALVSGCVAPVASSPEADAGPVVPEDCYYTQHKLDAGLASLECGSGTTGNTFVSCDGTLPIASPVGAVAFGCSSCQAAGSGVFCCECPDGLNGTSARQ